MLQIQEAELFLIMGMSFTELFLAMQPQKVLLTHILMV